MFTPHREVEQRLKKEGADEYRAGLQREQEINNMKTQSEQNEEMAFMAGHDAGSKTVIPKAGLEPEGGMIGAEQSANSANDVEPISYGDPQASVMQDKAEQLAAHVADVAKKNGVDPRDQQSIAGIVAQIFKKELSPEKMKANSDKVNQLGNLVVQLATDELTQTALVNGQANVQQQQQAKSQPQQQQQMQQQQMQPEGGNAGLLT